MDDTVNSYNYGKTNRKDIKLENTVNYIRKNPEILRNEMHPFSAEK